MFAVRRLVAWLRRVFRRRPTSRRFEFVGDEYGLAFQAFNVGGLVERMKLTGAGQLLVVNQPGFLAYNSSDDTGVTSATVDFDTEVYDDANNFTNDVFTAPVAARYLLTAAANLANGAGVTAANLNIITSNRTYLVGIGSGNGPHLFQGTAIVDMDAADQATVQVVVNGTITVTGQSSPILTYFSGRLVPCTETRGGRLFE